MQKICLSDITMKLTEGSDGLLLSFKEKIELAKLLDRLNVSAIELCPIKNRKIDSLLVKSIATAVKHSTVAVPVSKEIESVDCTWAALKEAKHPRLQLCAPMSPAQMEYFWHKKPEKLLESIREIITRCRALCPDVEFIADDACRSEKEFLCRAIRCAIEAGASAVTLCDAAGTMLPEELAAFIEVICAAVPELENVRLGVLCSDELSMANACAIAAVRAGAQEIKVVSCRGKYTRTAEFASILKNRGDAFGLYSDLRFSEVKRITDQIAWTCSGSNRSAMPANMRMGEAENDLLLTEHDDRAAVLRAVEKLGYDLSEEDSAKVYEEFVRIAAKRGKISAPELETIVASTALQVPPTYRLSNYVVNCGNNISASAHLKIAKGEECLEGISLGDGPIDAAFHTIEQALGLHYELDDFQIRAVTEGREAMGETVVRLRSNGKIYSGRGISTDIVGASIHAYISAVNKIVYEEAEA